MTNKEKTDIAAFLDTAGDYLTGGYRRNRVSGEFAGPARRASVRGSAPAGQEEPAAAGQEADSLDAVASDISRCTRCGLCSTRTNTVPGEGVPRPLVMVVGEGPGADEDATGRPFVGRAGQLLDKILDSQGKIGLSRNKNCYIANVVKCRPPKNRDPLPDETAACAGFLRRQIALLKPRVILTVGNPASKTLLGTTDGITKIRGTFTNFNLDGLDIPLLPTFHPSALLRDESLKVPVWKDMQTLRIKLCGLNDEYAALVANMPL
ncbi:MAG: uracil-DNA glycosylase [Treponema sp.]|nr:uracil-DNA glycosylase [Treponema sp.]